MSDAVIELCNATKTYQVGAVEVRALRGVTLRVERAEFVAIMGVSGSGKSTLLNILGCLDRATSGNYFLEGRDISRVDEPSMADVRSRRIGFIFQSFNLLSRASTAENVALPLVYAGRLVDSSRRVRAALRAMGLEEFAPRHPSQLSGGQQQRVAIARALVNDPAILLADEPTGNLDSESANDIMATIQTLNRGQGLTVVLVTHDPDIAAFADRLVMLRDGLIVSDEPTKGRPSRAPVAGAEPLLTPQSQPGRPADSPVLASFLGMALRVAGRAIARNKTRSALTMLGVFIGVAALIAMVAVGQGANAAVTAQIQALGSNLLIVLPGATTANGVRAGFGSASTLTVADAAAIKQDLPAVRNVSVLIRQLAQVQYGSRNWTTSVQGVTPSYFRMRSWPVAAGRTLSQGDEAAARRVCLIGQSVYRNLFGAYENPVGATILVKGVPMRVMGLLAAKGQTGFGQDQDDVVIIPFTTAELQVLGVATPAQAAPGRPSIYGTAPNPFGEKPKLSGYVNIIFVQAQSPALVPSAATQVTRLLDTRHRISAGQPQDFDVRNLASITQALQGSSRTMALLLATVASISLVVGGIGIMNILLVSVTERTREIGIRMAIGARRLHVLLQFLVEAMLLSGIGGVAGVAAGALASKIVSLVAGWPTLLSPAAILGGFLFAGAVGVFFGYYPARRASLLNPIDALRYE